MQNPMSKPPTYDEYSRDGQPNGSGLLEVEDGLTMNQRAYRPQRDRWGWLREKLWMNIFALWFLWFITFVIACCAMAKANKSHSSSSSSSSDLWVDRCVGYDAVLYGDEAVSFAGHHYQIVGGNWVSITWRAAEQDAWGRCFNGKPGYLASIESDEENDFLLSKLTNHAGFQLGDQAWIGGTDMYNEGTFQWIDGYAAGQVFYGPDDQQQGYSLFSVGEPNNNGNEDCVSFNDQGYWNDDSCYKGKQYFFVEFDA